MKKYKVKINYKNLAKGITKCAGGIAIAGIIPAALATSIYFCVASNQDLKANKDYIKNSTEFQQVYNEELAKTEEKFNNGEIQLNEKQQIIKYINSTDFIEDFAQSYGDGKFDGYIKSDVKYNICIGAIFAASVGLSIEIPLIINNVLTYAPYAINKLFESGVDDLLYNTKEYVTDDEQELKKEPENLPEVNLE